MNSSSLLRLITHFIRDLRRVYPNDALLRAYFESDDPIGFSDLYSLVPLDMIGDVFYINALTQLRSFSKKYLDDIQGNSDRSKRAIDLFRSANINCRATNRRLRSLNALSSAPVVLVLNEARSVIESWFNACGLLSPNMAEIAANLRHGPGASRYCSGTTAYQKDALSRTSSSSSGLSRLYHSILKYDPNAYQAELERAQNFGDIVEVIGSKISTVPKSIKIDRTICIEPTVNMLFQLSTGKLLESVLSRMGISLDTQPDINRLLAKYGSIDGSFGTIDLSSASDSVSLALCKWLLPPVWYNWLTFIRSRYTLVNNKYVPLHMMSSMGNGFTFPLQTILFAGIVVASYNIYGVRSYRHGIPRFGVFGDDIIVDKQCFQLVIKNLIDCGFRINMDKTFNHGGFRESCGHDWFHGFSIRPVYVSSLRSKQDRISLLNRLIRWSARTHIPIPDTCGYILASLQGWNVVPPWESDDAGIKVPYCIAKDVLSHLRLQTKNLRLSLGAQHGALIYKRDTPVPNKVNIWCYKGGVLTQLSKVLKYPVNTGALMLSILGGYVRGTGLVTRARVTRYKSEVLGIAPGWDAPMDPAQFAGWRVSYAEWTTATLHCLEHSLTSR